MEVWDIVGSHIVKYLSACQIKSHFNMQEICTGLLILRVWFYGQSQTGTKGSGCGVERAVKEHPEIPVLNEEQ